VSVASYDTIYADRDSKSWRLGSKFTDAAASAAEAAQGADLVISAVTAAQTLAAAKAAAPGLAGKAIFLDLNSASPGVKREAAGVIDAVGGRYIEAAVMSPIGPKRIATSMLFGGAHAQAALGELQALGFSGARFFSAELGKASAAKMCRSVMVKGIEALLSESLLAARSYGVEDTVLKSLDDLFPGPDWPELARYMISRTLEHGVRRSEEMREAARTVSEAGLAPHMSQATAERQAWAPQFADALDEAELDDMLDAMRRMMKDKPQ
jgi:3-hydroxyisobutyrate dehydrogenase-like beta-hydroxyacid dehydrogenase